MRFSRGNRAACLLKVVPAATFLTSACGRAPADPGTLTVMTHDSFAVSEELVASFEAEHNVKIQFLKAGDTGTALNKAILSKGNPLADVFYGVDNTFLSRALAEGIFEAYNSPLLAEIPTDFKLDRRTGCCRLIMGMFA